MIHEQETKYYFHNKSILKGNNRFKMTHRLCFIDNKFSYNYRIL